MANQALTPEQCVICTTLTPEDLSAFDAMLAQDPRRWPKDLWHPLKRPTQLNVKQLSWAVRRLGEHWLANNAGADRLVEHGGPVHPASIEAHYWNHIAAKPESIAILGVPIREERKRRSRVKLAELGPNTLDNIARLGLTIGQTSLQQLERHIRDHPEEFSAAELMKFAELGLKAADIKRVETPGDDGVEAFRQATKPPQRAMPGMVAHEIEGKRRVVRDEGRADRRKYNERARQEGSPLLPA